MEGEKDKEIIIIIKIEWLIGVNDKSKVRPKEYMELDP